MFALNLDAARYCRTPLFKEVDEPNGVGDVENVTIRNMRVYKTTDSKNSLIFVGTNWGRIKIENFEREREKEPKNTAPTFSAGKMKPVELALDGKTITATHNERIIDDRDRYNEVLFTALKG